MQARAVQCRQLPGPRRAGLGVSCWRSWGELQQIHYPHLLPATAAVLAAVMFFLFGSSVYAGYLGFQWRRTR